MAETITVKLDAPRTMMYDDMCDLVGHDQLQQLIDQRVHELVTHLYDTKEQ